MVALLDGAHDVRRVTTVVVKHHPHRITAECVATREAVSKGSTEESILDADVPLPSGTDGEDIASPAVLSHGADVGKCSDDHTMLRSEAHTLLQRAGAICGGEVDLLVSHLLWTILKRIVAEIGEVTLDTLTLRTDEVTRCSCRLCFLDGLDGKDPPDTIVKGSDHRRAGSEDIHHHKGGRLSRSIDIKQLGGENNIDRIHDKRL